MLTTCPGLSSSSRSIAGDVLRRVIPESDEELGTPGWSPAGEEAELRRADRSPSKRSETSFSRSSISTTAARVCSGAVPGGSVTSICRLSVSPPNRLTGMTARRPRLDSVIRKAASSVMSPSPQHPPGGWRCRRAAGRSPAARAHPPSPAPSGRSPGRRRYAPRTGTAVKRDEQRRDEREGDSEREGREERAEEAPG